MGRFFARDPQLIGQGAQGVADDRPRSATMMAVRVKGSTPGRMPDARDLAVGGSSSRYLASPCAQPPRYLRRMPRVNTLP